jgi:AraC family transcriptional regulator, transcriptional activator of pobA
MKNQNNLPLKFNSISELHNSLGLPKPLHPLVSLVNYADIKLTDEELPKILLLNFYKISFKFNFTGKIRYGQGYYDFSEGGLCFYSPGQLIASAEEGTDYSGYTLLFHPDFIRQQPLATKMKNYGFFTYSANEGLFISDKERKMLTTVFENIKEELDNPIDEFSQEVMVSHIEVLLNYSSRFYKRQFITRKAVSHDLLVKMETLLDNYFDRQESFEKGLPTVEYLAGELNMSPRYLSDMLRSLTGQNAQQHIHEKLIEKAKQYLTGTQLSVSEVAYQLGFEHSQSFNKLFKKKTALTPVEFKQSFN